LDLPQDIEAALAEKAQRQGVSLERYGLWLLSGRILQEEAPRTGADLVEFWKREGVLGSRPDIKDSEAHSRGIRESAQRLAVD